MLSLQNIIEFFYVIINIATLIIVIIISLILKFFYSIFAK
jgi:hypothetical protein